MKASAAKVLGLLRQRPQTTGDFARAFCPRASARIHELRGQGYEIDAERITANAYRYTLRAEPEPPRPAPAAAPPAVAEPQLFDTIDLDIPPPGYADPEAA